LARAAPLSRAPFWHRVDGLCRYLAEVTYMSEPNPNLTAAFFAALPNALRPYWAADLGEILRVPAKAPEVGDIVVRNDGDELTVCIGRINHRHFEVYCLTGATEQERQREVAENATEWIVDILAERVRFRAEFEAGRLIAGSSWHIGHRDGGGWPTRTGEVREYTWSGEKFHSHLAAG
jgi:hypothetical protein